ncbi:MAG: SIS domain-containing protein [Ilumatobacteraceae bacterium]
MNLTFSEKFIAETVAVLNEIDPDQIEAVARGLAMVRGAGGRLFILGVGGSAAHAGHAVNDFRKICGFEAYAPTDSVSELTARINDDGWESAFANWLIGSRLAAQDGIVVLSVGGGDPDRYVSVNLIRAIELCKEIGASVFGIVGRDGGYTAQSADACIVIPPVFVERIAAHTEGLCAVVLHLLVSHPNLRAQPTHWELVAATKATTDANRLPRLVP